MGSFGEVNNLRYWYVDAMVKFVPGIPMGVAPYQIPMDIYGFGGGAFYHLTMQGIGSAVVICFQFFDISILTTTIPASSPVSIEL